MVTATVGNQVWKTRGAACNVHLLYSEEDMAEGGHDSRGPYGIFPPSKRTKSAVWAYFGYYKNAQGHLI